MNIWVNNKKKTITWTAKAPNFVADRLFNDPPKEPIGVLVALTIKTSLRTEDVDMCLVVFIKFYSKKYAYVIYVTNIF